MKRSVLFITISTVIHTAGFIYALGEHLGDPTWSAHAQFHHVLGAIWLTGMAIVTLLLTWGPWQRSEKWSFVPLLTTGGFAQLGFFVAQLIVPSGRPPELWHHLSLAAVMIVYGVGLFIGWKKIVSIQS